MNVTVALVVIILRLWSLMEGKQTPLRSGSLFKAMECPSGLDQIMHTCIYSLAQRVKNLPAMRESWVQSLGWEDPLEKGKATHSSILAWRIP